MWLQWRDNKFAQRWTRIDRMHVRSIERVRATQEKSFVNRDLIRSNSNELA